MAKNERLGEGEEPLRLEIGHEANFRGCGVANCDAALVGGHRCAIDDLHCFGVYPDTLSALLSASKFSWVYSL